MPDKKPVVIVGLGALGSHVVLAARNWEQPLRLIDFDFTEFKNTQAQFCTKMGLRQNKARAIAQVLQGMWGLKVEAISNMLIDANTEVLLHDACLVIDCVDNGGTRKLIQDFVRQHKIPCLHGAINAAGNFARAMWDEHFDIDFEKEAGATCEDGINLPFHIMVGGQIANIAQTYLTTGKKISLQMTHTSTTVLVRE